MRKIETNLRARSSARNVRLAERTIYELNRFWCTSQILAKQVTKNPRAATCRSRSRSKMNRLARSLSWSASVASRLRNVVLSVDSEARQTWISPRGSSGIASGDDHSLVEFISRVSDDCDWFSLSVLGITSIDVSNKHVVRAYLRERSVFVYHSPMAIVRILFAFTPYPAVRGRRTKDARHRSATKTHD